jgi:hypothetical protein
MLEEALRAALDSMPRDQVVKAIVAALPAETLVDEAAPGGKARKVSVSMPEELTKVVRTNWCRGFSHYVTDAVSREVRHDLLGDLLDDLEAEYGPVPPEVRAGEAREWPDYEDE